MEGGRNGSLKTEDKALDLKLRKPTEMGGENNGVDPENLFAAGYASCLASSIEFLLEQQGKQADDIVIDANLSLVGDPDGGFKFDLEVVASIKGFDKSEQEKLLEAGLGFCPYSKAIKGNVNVNAKIA